MSPHTYTDVTRTPEQYWVPRTPLIPLASLPSASPPNTYLSAPQSWPGQPSGPVVASPSLTQISFDLSRPPWTLSQLVPPYLSEPATWPPVQALSLTSPDLLWDITVQASSMHITVLDVVRRLCKFMQKSLKPAEFRQDKVVPHRTAISGFWHLRLEAMAPNEVEHAREKGACRIDLLCGKTVVRFTGSVTEDSEGLKLGIAFSRS